jgi:hypothetical protein
VPRTRVASANGQPTRVLLGEGVNETGYLTARLSVSTNTSSPLSSLTAQRRAGPTIRVPAISTGCTRSIKMAQRARGRAHSRARVRAVIGRHTDMLGIWNGKRLTHRRPGRYLSTVTASRPICPSVAVNREIRHRRNPSRMRDAIDHTPRHHRRNVVFAHTFTNSGQPHIQLSDGARIPQRGPAR